MPAMVGPPRLICFTDLPWCAYGCRLRSCSTSSLPRYLVDNEEAVAVEARQARQGRQRRRAGSVAQRWWECKKVSMRSGEAEVVGVVLLNAAVSPNGASVGPRLRLGRGKCAARARENWSMSPRLFAIQGIPRLPRGCRVHAPFGSATPW